jgi:hypothetical protein
LTVIAPVAVHSAEESNGVQIGDNVNVRATGRRARIIEDLGNSHYRVLFFADPDLDALDRDTPQDEDDAGGVYTADDLEAATDT